MVKITKDITKATETSYERRFSAKAEMTSNGAKFLVRHEFEKVHEDGDIMADKAAYNYDKDVTLVDIVLPNGQKLEDGTIQKIYPQMCTSKQVKAYADAGCEYVVGFNGFGYIGISKENEPAILAMVAEVEKAAEDNVAEIVEKKEAEKKAKIESAEKTIARAEKWIETHGKLMTRKEADRYQKQLNDCLNEGGEGFLPPYPPTVEAYNTAKKTLAELKK